MCSLSWLLSRRSSPTATHAHARDPTLAAPHARGPLAKTCSSFCLSSLHLLRSWSLRQTRGDSVVADSTSVSAYYALAEATSELAEMWNFQGDMEALLEGAAAAGEMLRDLDPTSYAGYYQIGHAAIRRLRPAEALSNLRRAHDLNPNDSRTLQCLGWAEFNVGLAETAKQHAELALRLSPRDPQRYQFYWVLAFAAFVADAPLEGV